MDHYLYKIVGPSENLEKGRDQMQMMYLIIGWNSWVEKARRMARWEVVTMWWLQQRHQLVAAACRLCCDPYCRQGWPKQTRIQMSGQKYKICMCLIFIQLLESTSPSVCLSQKSPASYIADACMMRMLSTSSSVYAAVIMMMIIIIHVQCNHQDDIIRLQCIYQDDFHHNPRTMQSSWWSSS